MPKRKAFEQLIFDNSRDEKNARSVDVVGRNQKASNPAFTNYEEITQVPPSGEFSFIFGNGTGGCPCLVDDDNATFQTQCIFGSRSVKQKGVGGQTDDAFTASKISNTSYASSYAAVQFRKQLSSLNQTFLTSVQNAIIINPEVSLIPLVKDYLQHSQVLLEQFKDKVCSNNKKEKNFTQLKPSFKNLGEYFGNFEEILAAVPQEVPPPPPAPQTLNLLQQVQNYSPSTVQLSKPINTTNNSFATVPHAPKSNPPPILQSSSLPFGVLGEALSFFDMVRPASTQDLSVCNARVLDANRGKANFATSAPELPVSFPAASNSPTEAANVNEDNDGADCNTDDDDDTEKVNMETSPKTKPSSESDENVVFTTRCKVLVIGSDKEYKDRGKGTLYLKRLLSGDNKYHIVVRADNQLESIILNILLSKSLPLKKQSPKSIMTIDLQGGKQGKGVPTVIKLASEKDTDELLAKLVECQQQQQG